MHGSQYFQWLGGPFHKRGYLKTTNLPLSDANANAGTIPRGKLVNEASGSEEQMAYTTGDFLGILEQPVDAYGVTGDLYQREREILGKIDFPIRRGLPVSIRIPGPGSQAIFEGKGAVLYDNLVATSGTGLISSATARKTELTCEKGCWRLAAEGEMVLALMVDASLTPVTATQVRIRVEFVSKYLKPTIPA